MHEYDTVLKGLLQGSPNSIVEQIAGVPAARWFNVELPEVQQTRIDLLFESAQSAEAPTTCNCLCAWPSTRCVSIADFNAFRDRSFYTSVMRRCECRLSW
jgi:hypothetical protein